jgi:hypothetical protein
MTLMERVALIDTERVTVETVRALFLWTPKWLCRQIIATCVRRGEFVENPDGSIRLATHTSPSDETRA